ncbi:MAG: hypothetical protein M3Y40_07265 [Chloroflexota bacterium]|nr:hypothetical protein [Chloroflexota bacterium]
MDRRDWLTFLLMLPFVASLPYVLPPPDPLWARFAVAVGYTLLGGFVARFVAGRLSR